ncbi:AzlC family ABC transporter permease [Desulfotomaculum copahuensis]|nr:AzlC family ABC transporter permease [Desulfotomaculum copahuensis]
MTVSKDGIIQGLKGIAPFSLSVFAYGLVYGILARTAHLDIPETLAMSVLVFAGSSQFAALSLIAQGAGGPVIVLTTFLINLRQALYGLSLGPHLKKLNRGSLALLACGLTDESYGVTIQAFSRGYGSAGYFLGAGLGVFVPWVLSSLLGIILSAWIADPLKFGLDFAFIGAFLGLLVAQINNRKLLLAALLSAAAALCAQIYWSTTGAIITGGLCAFLLGVLIDAE